MLTTKKLHNINRGRAENSKHSGYTAPTDLADFFISSVLSKIVGSAANIQNKPAGLCSSFQLPTPCVSRELLKKGNIDMSNLVFKGTALNPIIINNKPYLTIGQIANALQYGKNERVCHFDTPFGKAQLTKLFERHADEFTPEMSFTTQIDTAGGKQMVRVFSLRGCHLLAMFSKTPVAKEFRKWVLDLIEAHNTAITNSQTADMKAIGGIVKSCCASAFRAEFEKISTDLVYKKILTDIIAKAFSDLRDDNAMQDVVSSIINNIVTGRVKNEYSKIITENNELKEKLEKIKSISSSNNCLRRVA